MAKKSRTKAKPKRAQGETPKAAIAGRAKEQQILEKAEKSGARWTFLTNHSHVLLLLARDPSMVLREVAIQVGITERAVQRIIADLEQEGFIEREKIGRQNHYRILADKPLRHSIESHRTVSDLIELINQLE